MSEFSDNFGKAIVKAQAIETARGEWKNHIGKTCYGHGQLVHNAISYVQKGAALFALGIAPTMAIPVVGEFLESIPLSVYFASTAVKGLLRTSAENHAVTQAGGTKENHAGVKRTLTNIAKSAVPFVTIK